MKKYFAVLRTCPLFRGIGDAELTEVLACLGAAVGRFGKRETIIAEGEPVRNMGIVLSGTAVVEQTDYLGNRSILASLEPGELFGEIFACAGAEKLPVNVVAERDTEILFVDSLKITQPCSRSCAFHQQILENLLRVVAAKSLGLQQKLQIVTKRTTREKLMAYLNVQTKKTGSRRFEIPYDRQGLADYLGVDRSGLSAEIGKLRREGVLEAERNWFQLL